MPNDEATENSSSITSGTGVMRHDKRRDRDAACVLGRNSKGPYECPQASACGKARAVAGVATARVELRAGQGVAPAKTRRHPHFGHGEREHQACQRQGTPHRTTRAGDGASASTRRASAMLSSVPESVQDPRTLRSLQLCKSTSHSGGMRWQSFDEGVPVAAHGWTQNEPLGRSTSPRQVAGHQWDGRKDEARTSHALSAPGGYTPEISPTTSESARLRQSAPRPFDTFLRNSEAELVSDAGYLESIIDVLVQPSPTAGAKASPFTPGPDASFPASSSNASPFSSEDIPSLPAPGIPSNRPLVPASSVSSNMPGNSAQASVHQEQHLPPTRLVPYFQPHYQPFHPQPPVPNYNHTAKAQRNTWNVGWQQGTSSTEHLAQGVENLSNRKDYQHLQGHQQPLQQQPNLQHRQQQQQQQRRQRKQQQQPHGRRNRRERRKKHSPHSSSSAEMRQHIHFTSPFSERYEQSSRAHQSFLRTNHQYQTQFIVDSGVGNSHFESPPNTEVLSRSDLAFDHVARSPYFGHLQPYHYYQLHYQQYQHQVWLHQYHMYTEAERLKLQESGDAEAPRVCSSGNDSKIATDVGLYIRLWEPAPKLSSDQICTKSSKELEEGILNISGHLLPRNRCKKIMGLTLKHDQLRSKESILLIERACVLFISHLTLLAKHFRGERDNFILQQRDVVRGASVDPSMDFLVRVFMLNQPDSIASAIASHPGNAALLDAREMVAQHNSRRKNNARDRPGAGDENDSNENDGESSAAELLDSVHIK